MATAVLSTPVATRKHSRSTAICTTCGSTFHGVDRDEDGRPEVPESEKCSHPTCETQLCPAGCRDISFACDGCSHRFCVDHRIRVYGESFCVACALEVLETNEPSCTCRRIEVDRDSAAQCELHNDRSEWNTRMGEVREMRKLEEYTVAA